MDWLRREMERLRAPRQTVNLGEWLADLESFQKFLDSCSW
jgi:hypothetical protein